MASEHVIAICKWDSTFDNEQKAVNLQNYISQWSNSALLDELDKYFEYICPANQIWRIDKIQLDLGRIILDELADRLPERLKDGLDEAFYHLFQSKGLSVIKSNDENFQIFDEETLSYEFVRYYLQYGALPWWYKGSESIENIVGDQLDNNPDRAAAIIHELGRSDYVRKRIAWQFGDKLIRKIIHALEPWQGESICEYADNVMSYQAQHGLVDEQPDEFRSQFWYVVITYLLVDRGTLFNTADFIAATLRQISVRYQVEYRDLLAQLAVAAHVFKRSSGSMSRFITAIKLVQEREESKITNADGSEKNDVDLWAVFSDMLNNHRMEYTIQQQNISFDEIFSALMMADAQKLRKFIIETTSPQTLTKCLSEKYFKQVIKLFLPYDYGYVLAYADCLHNALDWTEKTSRCVWQSVLEFIVNNTHSRFHRYEFSSATLSDLVKRRDLDKNVLLDKMLGCSSANPDKYRLRVLSTLQEINQKDIKNSRSKTPYENYLQPIRDYLSLTEVSDTISEDLKSHYPVSRCAAIFRNGFCDQNDQDTDYAAQGLLPLIRHARTAGIPMATVSERLLKMVRPVNLSDILNVIQPAANGFILQLLKQFCQWYREGRLSCLNYCDFAFQVPVFMIQALLEINCNNHSEHNTFDVRNYWQNFSNLLLRYYNINAATFNAQIMSCLLDNDTANSESEILNKVLLPVLSDSVSLHSPASDIVYHSKTRFSALSKSQLFNQARQLLSSKDFSLQNMDDSAGREFPAVIPVLEMEKLLKYITGEYQADFLLWLNRQVDYNVLLNALRNYSHIVWVRKFLASQPARSAQNNAAPGMPLPAATNIQYDNESSHGSKHKINQILAVLNTQDASPEIISQRLLDMIESSDFYMLLGLLQPAGRDFCYALVENLRRWYQHAWLPSLHSLDFGRELYQLIIQALLIMYKRQFAVPVFWTALLKLFENKRIDTNALQQQLQQCIETKLHPNEIEHPLWLLLPSVSVRPHRQRTQQQLQNEMHVVAGTTHWNQLQLFHALQHKLLAPGTGTIAHHMDIPGDLLHASIDKIWGLIERRHSTAFDNWIVQHAHKDLLIRSLSDNRHSAGIGKWLLNLLPAEYKQPQQIINDIAAILLQHKLCRISQAKLQRQLYQSFYLVNHDAARHNLLPAQRSIMLAKLICYSLNIRVEDFIQCIATNARFANKNIWKITDKPFALNKYTDTVSADEAGGRGYDTPFYQDYLGDYLQHPCFKDIFRHLLKHGRVPDSLKLQQPVDLQRLLFDVLTSAPNMLEKRLPDLIEQHAVMFRLLQLVSFDWIISAMHQLGYADDTTIHLLQSFYRYLRRADIDGLHSSQKCSMLNMILLKLLINNAVSALSLERIVNRYLWELCQYYHISHEVLCKVFLSHTQQLPGALQTILNKNLDTESAAADFGQHSDDPSMPAHMQKAHIRSAHRPDEHNVPMHINNAGLVILQGFIKPLFERLDLIHNDSFVSDAAQRRAVHYLQYIVTGYCETDEHYLAINKLLCGMNIYEPLSRGIDISDSERSVCHSLLESAINYWDAIGASTIDGFRGNWLVRDASLSYNKDHWDLIVEKRAYDILLTRSPFSYSVIKLPWMKEAVYVTWPT